MYSRIVRKIAKLNYDFIKSANDDEFKQSDGGKELFNPLPKDEPEGITTEEAIEKLSPRIENERLTIVRSTIYDCVFRIAEMKSEGNDDNMDDELIKSTKNIHSLLCFAINENKISEFIKMLRAETNPEGRLEQDISMLERILKTLSEGEKEIILSEFCGE